MKLSLRSLALCRTPAFPMNSKIEEVWPDLKGFILDASPSFYKLIEDVEPEALHTLSPKIRFTIWKYFNRARFRATPFGKLAAYSIVPITSAGSEKENIILSSPLKIHEYCDWSFSDQFYDYSQVQLIRSNSSFYVFDDEIRFLKKNETQFQLSSVEYDKLTYRLLNFCRETQSIKVVCAFLVAEGVERMDVHALLEEFIDMQLLTTDRHPNIIGKDFFSRLVYDTVADSKKYIISEREHLNGSLSNADLSVLKELASLLVTYNDPTDSQELDHFKRRFIDRYPRNARIPILEAIDPELGIGFGDFAQEIEEDEFVVRLKESKDPEPQQGVELRYTELSKYILNNYFSNQSIKLEDFKNERNSTTQSLPNTFSALVELIDDRIVLKSMGGVTAASLMGRFTLGSEVLHKEARELAQLEATANPDVLFFDIAYHGEKKVDNVSRREAIYEYELPILSWSDSKQIIDLNDMLVTVEGDEIIIFSRKYGRRMVPRLASAYNYVRSDLSIFRFLTDLQRQNLHPHLSISISNMFPGLDYYPRLTYKNVILSPAKWLVPNFLCKSAARAPHGGADLLKWLNEKQITSHFMSRDDDQSLIYSVDTQEDLQAFLLYAKNRESIYIEEVFLATQPLVIDESDRKYNAEFVVSFTNSKQIYQPYYLQEETKKSTKAAFLPGEDWLYYEIYCHSSRSNEILNNFIVPFIEANEEHIEKWFFIRYNDPSYHLRFRMKVKTSDERTLLMDKFNDEIQAWTVSKKVTDVQMKRYDREIDRYGDQRIDDVEDIFHYDSKVVLTILAEGLDRSGLYARVIILFEQVLDKAQLGLEAQLNFLKGMADSFGKEHKMNKKGFKLINDDYRNQFNADIPFPVRQDLALLKADLVDFISQLADSCRKSEKNSLLADLFHMHVNRLFHNDQRVHELVIYQFLYKRLMSRKLKES